MRIFLAALCALACVSFSSAYSLSPQMFKKVVASAGYPPVAAGHPAPTPDIYAPLSAAVKDFSEEEVAMFLAQVIYESEDFAVKEETSCFGLKDCPDHSRYVDNVGLPDHSYHGRGFIQLRCGANYKAASEGLGLGDKLLQHPELVSEQTDLSVSVSVWYWKAVVRPAIAGKENQFGATTKAMSRLRDCSTVKELNASDRYELYLKVAKAMGIKTPASADGSN